MKKRKDLKLPLPPPRNPLVAAAKFRKAGTHKKSEKATRSQEKALLKKVLADKGTYVNIRIVFLGKCLMSFDEIKEEDNYDTQTSSDST